MRKKDSSDFSTKQMRVPPCFMRYESWSPLPKVAHYFSLITSCLDQELLGCIYIYLFISGRSACLLLLLLTDDVPIKQMPWEAFRVLQLKYDNPFIVSTLPYPHRSVGNRAFCYLYLSLPVPFPLPLPLPNLWRGHEEPNELSVLLRNLAGFLWVHR